ncbi:hypothetical protein DSUL_20041 [Desulfovibrionales bacterium]
MTRLKHKTNLIIVFNNNTSSDKTIIPTESSYLKKKCAV